MNLSPEQIHVLKTLSFWGKLTPEQAKRHDITLATVKELKALKLITNSQTHLYLTAHVPQKTEVMNVPHHLSRSALSGYP